MILPLVLVLHLAKGCLSLKQPCLLVPLPSNLYYCDRQNEMLAKFNNSILKIPVSSDSEFNTVVDFVARVFGRTRSDCTEVIGVVGDLDLKTTKIIHTLASRSNLTLTLVSAVAPSTFLPATNLALPNLLHMNPLMNYVKSLAAFIDSLNWTRIGLISENTPYYEFAAELIQQELLGIAQQTIVPFVRVSENHNKTKILNAFIKYKTDVIVISTNINTSCELVKEAKRVGLTWPKYAWILLDVEGFSLETCREKGAIFLIDQSAVSKSRCDLNSFLYSSNIHKLLLMDFVNNSLHLSLISSPMKVRGGNRVNNISIVQINSSNLGSVIASFNTESQQLNITSSFLSAGTKPRGTLLKIYYNDDMGLHTTSVVAVYLLLFLLVTTIFILYIYFRKEPEVKGTSVTISLCMFLGCYILITYLVLLVSPLQSYHCHLLVWFSLAGVPYVLIMATLFAKMLRVYLIFTDPLTLKAKLFTDPFLFLYILLLSLPNVFILVVWSIHDPVSFIEVEFPQDNSVLVNRRCESNHIFEWLIALLLYNCTLSCALTYLALKTSQIRFRHVRDTKATNAFVYLSCFVTTLSLIYWNFFYEYGTGINRALVSDIVLYVGHSTFTLLCQSLLFLPKVYPALKRRLSKFGKDDEEVKLM